MREGGAKTLSQIEIRVCMNQRSNGKKACCYRNGAAELFELLNKQIETHQLENVILRKSGCLDRCDEGPVVCISERKIGGETGLVKTVKSFFPARKSYYVRFTSSEIPKILEALIED